jgi:hypothetical protein
MMRRGPVGWIIECAGCGKEFDSRGLRCCSTDCERRYLKRCENEQLMAAVGMERPVKRKCEAPGCGRDIPNWRNGRRVSKATRFCSSRCKQAAYRGKGSVEAQTTVCYSDGPQSVPHNLLGGYQFRDAIPLDPDLVATIKRTESRLIGQRPPQSFQTSRRPRGTGPRAGSRLMRSRRPERSVHGTSNLFAHSPQCEWRAHVGAVVDNLTIALDDDGKAA